MAETPILRDISADKIVDTLEFLRNFGVVDKGVREGKKTQEDIARSFTGDPTAYDEDKGLLENIVETTGLLDFTPVGTVFAAQEADRDIEKAKGTDLQKKLALLGYLRQPLQTSLDRPDLGLPATELGAATVEAIPLTYVITRPIVGLFKSLGSKLRGDVSAPVDTSRRKFMKDSALVTGGAMATMGGLKLLDKPLAKAVTKTAKVAKAVPLNYDSALKKFVTPLYRNYLDEVIDNNTIPDADGKMQLEDLPIDDENAFEENSITANIYGGLFDKGEGVLSEFADLPLEEKAKLVEKNYGVKDGLHIKPNELSEKILLDSAIDFGGDYSSEFRFALQERAIQDGAKPNEIVEVEPEYAGVMVYKDAKASDNMADIVDEYYEKLIEEGNTPQQISEMVFEFPFPE
tara:strand:- start:3369 stop:4580 length:1212 start_codon:yes stop_codon:yes gene_type:complete